MKANYTPPKGVTQLTYNVSLEEITRLMALDQRSKVISEIPFQAIVKVKCGKQSDSNYKKWDHDTKPNYILNFNHKKFMYICNLEAWCVYLIEILEFVTRF